MAITPISLYFCRLAGFFGRGKSVAFRVWVRVLKPFMMGLGGLLFCLFLLAARLAMGPLDVTSFVSPLITHLELPQNVHLEAKAILIQYQGVKAPFSLIAEGVILDNSKDGSRIELPKTEIKIDYLALLSGHIRPRALHIHAPHLRFSLNKKESNETNSEVQTDLNVLAALVFLKEVSLIDASIVLEDAGKDVVHLEGMDIHLKQSHTPKNPSHLPDLAYTVRVGKINLDWPVVDSRSLSLQDLSFKGNILKNGEVVSLEVTPFVWQGFPLKVAGKGEVFDESATMNFSFDVTGGPVELPQFKDFWPEFVAPSARKWVTKNMAQGTVRNLKARLEGHWQSTNPEDARIAIDKLEGMMELEGTEVRFLKGLPPAQDVHGHARFSKNDFVVELEGGKLESIDLTGGRVHLYDLDKQDQFAKIQVTLAGGLHEILDILNYPPLEYPQKLGFNPHAFKGQFQGDLIVEFPLLKDLRVKDLELNADINTQNVSYLYPLNIGNKKTVNVENGIFNIKVSTHHLTMDGAGTLDGHPAKLTWYENFEDNKDLRRTLDIHGVFPWTLFFEMKVPLEQYMSDKVDVELKLSNAQNGDLSLDIKTDLTQSTVDIDLINWRKKAGEKVLGSFVLDIPKSHDKDWTLRNLSLTGADVVLKNGTLRMSGQDQHLLNLTLPTFQIGRTKASLVWQQPGKTPKIKVQGESFDARAYIEKSEQEKEKQKQTDESPDKPLRNMVLDLAVNKAWVRGDETVSDVKLKLVQEDDKYKKIHLQADLGNGKPLTVALTNAGGGNTRTFYLKALDAGRFLYLVDLYDHMKEGVLQIKATEKLQGSKSNFVGVADLTDFRVIKTPIFTEILSFISVGGIPDMLEGPGLGFTNAHVLFRFNDKNVYFTKGRAESPAVGITVSGSLDRKKKTVDLAGYVIPIYGVGSFISKIPLLGNILSGGKNNGILSTSYTVTGPFANMQTSVNPLTTLIPGFLKDLFSETDDSNANNTISPHEFEEAPQ